MISFTIDFHHIASITPNNGVDQDDIHEILEFKFPQGIQLIKAIHVLNIAIKHFIPDFKATAYSIIEGHRDHIFAGDLKSLENIADHIEDLPVVIQEYLIEKRIFHTFEVIFFENSLIPTQN